MQVGELLKLADGTIVTDVIGKISFVGDQKSGVSGSRQWTTQFAYINGMDRTSSGVTFWNRADITGLKGTTVILKSVKDSDLKMTYYNNKPQLQVNNTVSLTEYKKPAGGPSGVKGQAPKADFAKKNYGTSGATYAAVLDWAIFTTHNKLSKAFGSLKTVPDGFMATVNTLLIAYGNGLLVPDALEVRENEGPALEIPEVKGAKPEVPQSESGDGPEVDPAPGASPDDDIPF